MEELEKRLGYTFQDKNLLWTALTHSSYANENKKSGITCNERLEFLGDAILGVTVALYLYKTFPELPEGDMSRIRANLVCEAGLVPVAEQLDLGANLRLGHGEEMGGGRSRASILADAVEAVIAAVYLDGGVSAASALIDRMILSGAEQGVHPRNRDFKTELQELVQKKSGQTIVYSVLAESGPDHNKRFTVEVALNGRALGQGIGRSKKEAEQAAAEKALQALRG